MSKNWSRVFKLLRGKGLLFGLFFVFLLLPVLRANAQMADIHGSVVLEPSNSSSSRISVGGYQNFGSNPEQEDNISGGILIWVENKDGNAIYTDSDTEIQILDQVDKRFSPRLMAVRVGDSVRIKNSDPLYHNVFSLSKTKRFDVGRRSPNDFEDLEFDQPGVVDVFCDIHSDMHAIIRVLPENTVAWMKLDEDGDFLFDDISVGEYVIHFFALDDRERNVNVEVNGSESIRLGTIRL